MKYIVLNSKGMLKVEEYVKTLPEKFTKQFNYVEENEFSNSNLKFFNENYYMEEIEMLKLEDIQIDFNNEDHLISINGRYQNMNLRCEFKGESLNIKNIKFNLP